MPILIFLMILGVALYAGYRNFNTEYQRALRDSSAPFDENPIEPLRLSAAELDQCLSYLVYYRNLTPQGRARFQERVREYVESTRIVSVDNTPLTGQVRAFIAASAVQLTFGLRKWDIKHFHTIRIYPKEFYSRMNERYLKGGAAKNGVIWFSYKHYLSGYEDQENGINLGLHEMSHALMMNMEEGNQESEFNSAFEAFEPVGKAVMAKVKSGEVKFLRKYASTNFYEFFAVSMEEFFERPAEFRRQLPDLYKAIARLLNQDPLRVKDDYRVSALEEVLSTPVSIAYNEPEKKRKNFRFAKWHWSLTVLLIGAIVGPASVVALQTFLLISPEMLWALYFVIVAGGGIFYYRRLVHTQALNTTAFVLFLLLGLAPLTLSGMLALNRVVPVYEEVETYTLTGQTSFVYGSPKAVVVGHPYPDHPELLAITWDEQRMIQPGYKFNMIFQRGLFWIRYHKRNEIVAVK
jgi:MtfA peptidase